MTVPPPAPDQPLPKGARYKGSRRSITGIVLIVLGVMAACGGLTGDYKGKSPLPGALLLIAVGAWLIWWGNRLRSQKIVIKPKPKVVRPPKAPARGNTGTSVPAARTTSPTRPTGPASDRAVLDVTPHLEGGSFVSGNKFTLYNMDKHAAAIHRLVRAHKDTFVPRGRGGSGAFAAWGTVVPQPNNQYDPNAVQVHVDGEAVAYFSMEWIDIAHQALAANPGRTVVVPVVVRWWGGHGEYVWVFGSMNEAETFAAWLHKEDLRG